MSRLFLFTDCLEMQIVVENIWQVNLTLNVRNTMYSHENLTLSHHFQ